jgi:hypothetical protein
MGLTKQQKQLEINYLKKCLKVYPYQKEEILKELKQLGVKL